MKLTYRQPPNDVLDLPLGSNSETLETEWRNLAKSLPHTSYFQTPDWVLAWWETVGGRPPTKVALWRSDQGDLDAIATVSRVRRRLHQKLPLRLKVWANAGSGPGAADHCGWPALAHRQDDVRDWLSSLTGTVVLSNLDPNNGLRPQILPGFRRIEWTDCPRLLVPADSATIGRSNHFRRHLRNSMRRLESAGVTFKYIAPRDMNEEVIARVLSLHGERSAMAHWKTTFTHERASLHEALVARAGGSHGPAAMLAIHENDTIGAIYGFWWNHSFSYYQGGWKEEWASLSLGSVLNYVTIAECARQGALVYDFLRGPEQYKFRFGAVSRLDETWMRPTGLTRLIALAQPKLSPSSEKELR